MSKSSDFCKKAAQDWSNYDLVNQDWSKATEKASAGLFKLYGWRKKTRAFLRVDGEEYIVNVEFEVNPKADFENFTAGVTISDFDQDCEEACGMCLDDCMDDVFFLDVYNRKSLKPENGDTIKYIIGNFLVINEETEIGYIPSSSRDFLDAAEQEMYRCRVMLPLKAEIIRR